MDARAVARAYRTLEAERLVEVRERSGIYAAVHPRIGGSLPEEFVGWVARVLVESFRRGIAVPEVSSFFQRCTSHKVRCAFVESIEDVIVAFTHDLRDQLGLETEAVWVQSLPKVDSSVLRKRSVPSELLAADLIVTTGFCARQVGPLAEALGKPLIAATGNVDMVEAVEGQLRSGELTVICADPAFGRRISQQYEELISSDTQLRVISADDHQSVAALKPNKPVLLTRAARGRLGTVTLPLVFPHSPTISGSSALEILEFLIRFNLEKNPIS